MHLSIQTLFSASYDICCVGVPLNPSTNQSINQTLLNFHVKLLKELHWLPVQRRIDFKITTVVFKAIHGQSPAYINYMLKLCKPARDLRSCTTKTLAVPKCRTKTYGDRSFVNSAPKLWNALPSEVRNAASLSNFKKVLKTHLFKITYDT